jgi:hypothetical protein
MGRQRQEETLCRREACEVKHPRADLFHAPVAPITPTMVLGHEHGLEGRPPLSAGHPQQHLGLRYAGLDIEVLAMQGDTVKAVGRAREHRLGEGVGERLRGVPSACDRPQHLDRDGWEPPIPQQSLMGGGVEGGLPCVQMRR